MQVKNKIFPQEVLKDKCHFEKYILKTEVSSICKVQGLPTLLKERESTRKSTEDKYDFQRTDPNDY